MFSGFNNSASLGHYYKPPPPPVFTSFAFDIIGTHYTGSASNYPITVNPANTTDTYCSITNFNKTNAQNKTFTIYVKGKFDSLTSYSRMFGFGNNVNNFLLVSRYNTNLLQLSYGYKNNGSSSYSLNTSNILPNGTDYFHTFMRFNADTSKCSAYFYSYTGALIHNSLECAYTPSNQFANFTRFTLAQDPFTLTNYSVTIGLAGTYDSYLSTSNMSQIVNQSLN